MLLARAQPTATEQALGKLPSLRAPLKRVPPSFGGLEARATTTRMMTADETCADRTSYVQYQAARTNLDWPRLDWLRPVDGLPDEVHAQVPAAAAELAARIETSVDDGFFFGATPLEPRRAQALQWEL